MRKFIALDHLRTNAAPADGQPLIYWNETWRDAVQSKWTPKMDPADITGAHPSAHKGGNTLLQTCGGTFGDVVGRNGRMPQQYVTDLNAAYPDIAKTMLIRGDCGIGYKRLSYDALKMLVSEHAKAGVQVFQNFHGLNDTAMQDSVARAVQEVAAEEGLDLIVRGTLCIEDNKNVTLKSALAAAEKLIASGHSGFYLKSASGRLDPEFVGELTGALLDAFPDQPIEVHAHDTYDEAVPSYMKAIEAAVARGKRIGVDCLHPAVAGGTAQPSILKLQDACLSYENPFNPELERAIRANAPSVNKEALSADHDSLLTLAACHSASETKTTNARLQAAMYKARAPGGATATLKQIPGLVENLSAMLKTNDWDEIQIAIYEMQADILDRLGDPTQVTPYALMTTTEAAFALVRQKFGRDPLSDLTPATANYLLGGLGAIPKTADPALIDIAKRKMRVESAYEFLPADQLPSDVAAAKARLSKAATACGLDGQDFTNWEVVTAFTVGDASKPDMGAELVMKDRANTRTPTQSPDLPAMRYLVGVQPQAPEAAPGSLKQSWLSRNPVRPVLTHTLDAGVFADLGSHARFEQLAQDALEVAKFNTGGRPMPSYLYRSQARFARAAQARIDTFRQDAVKAIAARPYSSRMINGLNAFIDDVLATKGVDNAASQIVGAFRIDAIAPAVENELHAA